MFIKTIIMSINKEAYSRLLNERAELAKRLEGLSLFLASGDDGLIDTNQWSLLYAQQGHMRKYLETLNLRIKLIKDEIKED